MTDCARKMNRIHTCLDCSSVISSDAFMPLSVISLDSARSALDRGRVSCHGYAPSDHFASAFPILAALETCITRDKLLQYRMQLIFRTQAQFKRIHERNEALITDRSIGVLHHMVCVMQQHTCVVSATHLLVSGPASLECSTVAGTPTFSLCNAAGCSIYKRLNEAILLQ